MYDHKESKLKLRRQFEQRTWKPEETFSAYYHEKVILANRVPIDEEEILEYLVEGISNMQLRNQAKLQKFETNEAQRSGFARCFCFRQRSGPLEPAQEHGSLSAAL
ncbi:hypothetical protein DMN91_010892 [Ooceraea biroi]|uniref:Uncharacterized protein n=1 Tax=Ooceraea biroi TaxID=2015173 RepID=A0A3L8D916_OOCBI|nr:hypothetical protein DMN91_010892 [Ooceraea biroi]